MYLKPGTELDIRGEGVSFLSLCNRFSRIEDTWIYVRPKAKEKNDPKVQRFHTFAKRGDACHKCYNCQRSSSITFFLFLARCFSKLGYTKTIGFQFSCLISGCFWDPHVENSKNHSLRRIMEVPEVFEGELAP